MTRRLPVIKFRFKKFCEFNPERLNELARSWLRHLGDREGFDPEALSKEEIEQRLRAYDSHLRLSPTVDPGMLLVPDSGSSVFTPRDQAPGLFAFLADKDETADEAQLSFFIMAECAVTITNRSQVLDFSDRAVQQLATFAIERMATFGRHLIGSQGDAMSMDRRQFGDALYQGLLPAKPRMGAKRGPKPVPNHEARIRQIFCDRATELLKIGSEVAATEGAFRAAHDEACRRMPDMSHRPKDMRTVRDIVGLVLPWTTCTDILRIAGRV
jgi:hypothetical protein